MKAGVSTRPCASSSTPRRAPPSRCVMVNFRGRSSFYEHRVAVGKEAIALLDRVTIRTQHRLTSRKGANQHEERRLRQVEVRQQTIDHAELETGIDEKLRLARARPARGGTLERAQGGRADGEHAP